MVEDDGKAEEKDPEYRTSLPYTVEVRHDPEAEWPWFARVVELPGCMTWAETFEKLEPMIEDASRGWIEDALGHGDPVPEPRFAEEGRDTAGQAEG